MAKQMYTNMLKVYRDPIAWCIVALIMLIDLIKGYSIHTVALTGITLCILPVIVVSGHIALKQIHAYVDTLFR